jgi:hypothetical protein
MHDAVLSRWSVTATVLGLIVVLITSAPLAAETARQRQQGRDAEKRDEATQRREKQKRKAVEKAVRDAGAPTVVKLPEHDLQFNTLPDWVVARGGGLPGTVQAVVYLDPKADPRTPPRGSMRVRVLPIRKGKSLDDVIKTLTRELNCHGPHYKVEAGDELDLDGETARTLVFEPQEDVVKDHKSFVAVARHGDRAYVFSLATSPADYETFRPQAEKIMLSTKWLDGRPAPGANGAALEAAAAAKPAKAEAKQAPATTATPPQAETTNAGAGGATPPRPAEGDGLD